MKEDIWYVVPEIEVRIHESWIRLIKYCQESLPYGDLKIKVANAQPIRRLKETPRIVFFKQPKVAPTNGALVYIIPSLDFRVHEYWVNLIRWCQDYFNSGELEFKVVAGQPWELISAKQEVRFDKPDTLPNAVPLEFNRTMMAK